VVVDSATSAVKPGTRVVEVRWELDEIGTCVGFPVNVGFVGFSVVDFCKLGTDTLPFIK